MFFCGVKPALALAQFAEWLFFSLLPLLFRVVFFLFVFLKDRFEFESTKAQSPDHNEKFFFVVFFFLGVSLVDVSCGFDAVVV